MRHLESAFELELEGNLVRISEHEIESKRVFHVDFKGLKSKLLITVGLGLRDQNFWTSIPQGRQKEAERIGQLIAAHIRAKYK